MNNVDVILTVLRLMAATALAMLVLTGILTFWTRRTNNLVLVGGLGLLIMSIRNLGQALLTLWWSLTAQVEITEGARTFLAASNVLATLEHVALVVMLLILLGYIPVSERRMDSGDLLRDAADEFAEE